MKNLIILAVIAFLTFKAYQSYGARQRDKLVGVWSMEHNSQGITGRQLLKLESDGDVTVDLDASYQGRSVSKHEFGKWHCANSKLVIVFEHGEIPSYKIGREYGGLIEDLQEKSFTYKDSEGKVETWARFR